MGASSAIKVPEALSQHAPEIVRATDNLSNRWWRLNNLYWITNESAEVVKFKPNEAQENLYFNLWWLNVILKARQLGFCLDPDTRVLTAGLRWVRIGDVKPGDRLVGCSEEVFRGDIPRDDKAGRAAYRRETGRRYRADGRRILPATVEGVRTVIEPAYRIEFDDGSHVICTGGHRWLSTPWRSTELTWSAIEGKTAKSALKPGDRIRRLCRPWGDPNSDDRWIGSMIASYANPPANGYDPRTWAQQLRIYKRGGPMLDAICAYLESNGYNFEIDRDRTGKHVNGPYSEAPPARVRIPGVQNAMRLIGSTQAPQFNRTEWWAGRPLATKPADFATITSIQPLGEREMVDLQTNTKTFIAEGLVSHNSTFIQLFLFDACMFNPNIRAGVIAHTKDDARVLFRDKIKFAYDHLPEWLRAERRATTDSTNELVFSNGSSIRVGTSMRSGTLQYLHVSELGKIGRKFPEKDEEIRAGAMNTVHKDGFVFFESTAEGRSGLFYETCSAARNLELMRRDPGRMEFKIHFYPWWKDRRYVADPGAVLLTADEEAYFAGLEVSDKIVLTPSQKAWYAAKWRLMGEKMPQEFPSTYKEAFEVKLKGAIYGNEMARVRTERRITTIPYEPSIPVNTFWDLGRNDLNVIWFHQRVGPQNRFIDYMEDRFQPLDYYAKALKDKPYSYGRHYLPHDVEVTDISRADRKSREEVLRDLGVTPLVVVPRIQDLREGINMTRDAFPSCWFDESKCAAGINGLDSYQREWDDKLGEYRDVPRGDWASHPADAFRQFAQGYAASSEPSLNPTKWRRRSTWRTA